MVKIKELLNIVKMKKRINTLENEGETLENIIKDELYSKFMENLSETNENLRLKKENKKLRERVKALKDIIKEK